MAAHGVPFGCLVDMFDFPHSIGGVLVRRNGANYWSNSMPEQEAVIEETTNESVDETTEGEETDAQADGETDLGDAGKKALDAMKRERAAAKADAKSANARAEKAEAALADKDKPAEEKALDEARAEARAEATKAADARYIKSELKAAATGKLADPTDAALYINLNDFDVDDDGEVDSGALADAIAELLTRKPHLGMPDARKFGGSADQGAKGKPAAPAQLTENDVSRMTPSQINKARQQGLLKEYLGQSS